MYPLKYSLKQFLVKILLRTIGQEIITASFVVKAIIQCVEDQEDPFDGTVAHCGLQNADDGGLSNTLSEWRSLTVAGVSGGIGR